jgi:hypothetical protein
VAGPLGPTGPQGPTGATGAKGSSASFGGWLTGGSGTQPPSGQNFLSVGELGDETESTVAAIMPIGATLTQFYAYADNSVNNITFTVRVNNRDTALTCTIVFGQRCSDAQHSVSIGVGQTFAVRLNISPGTPVHFRVRYQ